MKIGKIILIVILIGIVVIILLNYTKLNIISGYNAKYIASSIFYGNRNIEYTRKHDLNFTPINLGKTKVDTNNKVTSSKTLGFLKREAIFRKGVGAALILKNSDKTKSYLYPRRIKSKNDSPYPYGDAPQKDTIFKNINNKKINQAVNTIFEDSVQTRSVIVIYKDQIIAEKYAEKFNENSIILGWSMCKSITSTIYGILNYQNKMDLSTKAPIKEWQNDNRKNITINNLLQMNSGLAWEEDYTKISDVTKMLFLSRNMGNVQRNKKLIGKPNETWNYSSGTTNLLSNILRMQFSTHQEYLDFWYSDLIDKIGMNSMLIETDLDGNYVGSSYAWATTRDWAKLGLLYLHNGNWNGQQIFDSKWIDYATTPTPTSNDTYGAQIWLNKGKKFPDAPTSMYYFSGYQGQYVFILPEQNLVIVRMGLTKKADINTFLKDIVTSIKPIE